MLFTSRAALRDLSPRLLRHAALCLRAEDVLAFLGRTLHGTVAGEIMNDWKRRWPGARVKHWMKANWIRMHDKHGCVLRIETVINDPHEFKVRRRCGRRRVLGWHPLPKGVAYLPLHVAVATAANHRTTVPSTLAEASAHFLAPAILDYVVNGRVCSRRGNDDLDAAPHSVYPAAGDDRWLAVAAETEAQWRALCDVVDRPAWAGDERFRTAAGRRAAGAEIDAAIAAWTGARDAHAAEAALQARSVPAAALQTSPDLCADSQLRARGHLASLPHPELGVTCVEGPRIILSRTPGRVEGDAPTLGRDNLRVLQDVLGYDEDRISGLVAAGLLD